MDKNKQKALAAIKSISTARSLRSFRKKIYAKTDLSYGESILAQHELIADKELVKTSFSEKRYKLARSSIRHYSFKEFLLSITKDSTCSDEIRQILLDAGLFNDNDSYKYLKELVFHLKHELLIRASNFALKKAEFLEDLYKGHFTPFFARTTIKNSFFCYQATVPTDAFNVEKCVDKNATKALLFGYPIYTDGKGNYIPVFCNTIDNIEQENAECYLKKLRNDKYLLNSCFVKQIAKTKGDALANDLLVQLHQTVKKDFSELENLVISKEDIPFENALLLVSNLLDVDFNTLNPQLLSDENLKEEIIGEKEHLLNKAVIVPIDEKEPYILYKLAQLETVLRLNEKELDKTALSCFSSRSVSSDMEIKLFEDLVFGRDLDSDSLKGAEPVVLCNALSEENSLMYVADDFDYGRVCEFAKKNLMLSNSNGAIVYDGFKKGDLKDSASLFEKDDDYNLSNDSESLNKRLTALMPDYKENEYYPISDFVKIFRTLQKGYDITFNQALDDEELALLSEQLKARGVKKALENNAFLSSYTSLREATEKILLKYYIGYRENKLSSFDVVKFNFANFLFIANPLTRLCNLKSPSSVESLKEFIKTVKLFDKYLKISYEKVKLKGIEAKQLQSVNKKDYRELKDSTDNMLKSLQEYLIRPIPNFLAQFKKEYFNYFKDRYCNKEMLSVIRPVCEFSSINEMAKSLFIPGIFDKTLMMVDKETNIADFVLALAKSKSVSIIVRKNDQDDNKDDLAEQADDISALSLIDNLSVDDDGLISMHFNQNQDERKDISSENIASSSIESFVPYLKELNLGVVKKTVESLDFDYLVIEGAGKSKEQDCDETNNTKAQRTVLVISQIDPDNLINSDYFEKGQSKLFLEYFDESLFKLNAKAYAKEFADKYKSLM